MPAYVVRIHPKPVKAPPFAHLVDFSTHPDWCFSTFDTADQWRDVLTGMKVAVGLHVCQFEVEELEPGLYAVVCNSHPQKPEGHVNLEEQISELRNRIDGLGAQIPNLPYASEERAKKEVLQQELLANLKGLENDPRRKT